MKRHPCQLLDLKNCENRVLKPLSPIRQRQVLHHVTIQIWSKYLQLPSKQRSAPWRNHALHTVLQAKLPAPHADEEKANWLPHEIGNGPSDEHDTGSPKFCKEVMRHASLKAAPPMQHAAASASESSE